MENINDKKYFQSTSDVETCIEEKLAAPSKPNLTTEWNFDWDSEDNLDGCMRFNEAIMMPSSKCRFDKARYTVFTKRIECGLQ